MRHANAGPDIHKASGKLVITLLLRRCLLVWFFSLVATQVQVLEQTHHYNSCRTGLLIGQPITMLIVTIFVSLRHLMNSCWFFLPGSTLSSWIDVYDSRNFNWFVNPTGLGQARGYLAAASLAIGLVFFAGGLSSGATSRLLACIMLFERQVMVKCFLYCQWLASCYSFIAVT